MSFNTIRSYYYYRGGQGYSEEYQAVLDAGIGTAPSAAIKTKDNTCINELKEAGIWDLLDVFYMLSTDDSDFARINWKAPASFQITKVNSPTFTANQGFTGNGTSSYLNTNWNPSTNSTNYTLDNGGLFAYAGNNISRNNDGLFGAAEAANAKLTFLNARNGSGNYSGNINGHAGSGAIASASGLFHLYRTDTDDTLRLYQNGSLINSSAGVAQGLPNTTIFLLAKSLAGVADNFSTRQIRCFAAGASLMGLETDLNTIISTRLA